MDCFYLCFIPLFKAVAASKKDLETHLIDEQIPPPPGLNRVNLSAKKMWRRVSSVPLYATALILLLLGRCLFTAIHELSVIYIKDS